MLTLIIGLINIFFAGMLAGIEFTIHYGVRAPAETLDDHAQLQLRQALVLKLRVLVPMFFVPTMILGIAITSLNVAGPGFPFQCVAVIALCIWAVIRVIGTIPINSATLTWQLGAPPSDWKTQVSHAERFHAFGVWAAVTAFVCFSIALSLMLVRT